MEIKFKPAGTQVLIWGGLTTDLIAAEIKDWEQLVDAIDTFLAHPDQPNGKLIRNRWVCEKEAANFWSSGKVFSGFSAAIFPDSRGQLCLGLSRDKRWDVGHGHIFCASEFVASMKEAIATAKELLIKEFVESIPGAIAILLPNKIPQHVLKLMLEVTGSDGDDLDYIVISNQSDREAVYEICDRIAYSYCISRYSWNDLLIVFVEH